MISGVFPPTNHRFTLSNLLYSLNDGFHKVLSIIQYIYYYFFHFHLKMELAWPSEFGIRERGCRKHAERIKFMES